MRGFVIIALLTSAMLIGCAKATDPIESTSNLLQVDFVSPTVGDPLDVTVVGSDIYVAENQGGFSIMNADNGSLINRYFEYNSMLMKTKRIDSVEDADRVYLVNTAGSDNIMDFDVNRIDGMTCMKFTGDTGSISALKVKAMTPEFSGLTADDQNYASSEVSGLVLQSNTIRYVYFGVADSLSSDYFYELFHYTSSAYTIEDVCMDDDYIYAAADQRGVLVFRKNKTTDIADNAVTLCGIADTPGEAAAIKVIGNYVYVADVQGGLQVVDVSDHDNPVCLTGSAVATGAFTRSIDGNSEYLMLGTYGDGVYLFDLSNPAHPVLKDQISKSSIGYVNRVKEHNGKFYVASRDKGVVAISIR